MKKRILAALALVLAGAVTLGLSVAVSADQSNKIKFKNRVNIKVGQAMVVHGYRGECGAMPTQARMKQAADNLNAKLTTGRIQFGKPGVRRSGACNGETPAVETIFVATTPGRERVKVHGDEILFIVK